MDKRTTRKEQESFEEEIYQKLMEAEMEAQSTSKRYTHKEVMEYIERIIQGETKIWCIHL